MEPLGLLVDFIEDLNRTDALGRSKPTNPIYEQDALNTVLTSSIRTSEQTACTIQSISPISESLQTSQPQHSSTKAPSSTVHTSLYMNPSSATRTWVDMDPMKHRTPSIGFEHGFDTHMQYQNSAIRQEPMAFNYDPAFESFHQQYHSGHTPPWTAYQSFDYIPSYPNYLQNQSHPPDHSAHLPGQPPGAPGGPYEYRCRDPSCHCQYFHPPTYYMNNDSAMGFRERWNANDPTYQSRLAGRR
ncbi:hypothetical protein J1614_001061 [Plenodomus biglobosus]|nr:hypothetical protein J1614_001061 [Plenodomus biglobosus]